jgi:hypothetical protein
VQGFVQGLQDPEFAKVPIMQSKQKTFEEHSRQSAEHGVHVFPTK